MTVSGGFRTGAIVAILPLAIGAAPAAGRGSIDAQALERLLHPPLGLPPAPIPESNPPSAAAIRLGRRLFLDRRLSRGGTLSCAMCHVPEQGFALNETRTAIGHEGRTLRRNAPTLLNAAYTAPYFHDGREPELELQAFDVFINPDEMAAPSIGALVATVRSLPDYPPLFKSAFGGPPNVDRVGRAIATYVRTLVSGRSPFDRWRYGKEPEAIDPAARRGFTLFTGKGRCAGCHLVGDESALFTDHRYHDTGIAWFNTMVRGPAGEPVGIELAPGVSTTLPRAVVDSVGGPPAHDLGRYEVTGDPVDRWRIKTPTLRNVALTAPYMHDGSISTLEAVIGFYTRGTRPHEGLDPILQPIDLTASDADDLVAFLESLTGDNIEALIRDARSVPVINPGD